MARFQFFIQLIATCRASQLSGEIRDELGGPHPPGRSRISTSWCTTVWLAGFTIRGVRAFPLSGGRSACPILEDHSSFPGRGW